MTTERAILAQRHPLSITQVTAGYKATAHVYRCDVRVWTYDWNLN